MVEKGKVDGLEVVQTRVLDGGITTREILAKPLVGYPIERPYSCNPPPPNNEHTYKKILSLAIVLLSQVSFERWLLKCYCVAKWTFF